MPTRRAALFQSDQPSRSITSKYNAGDQIALATPCKPLRKCIDLIVMAPGKRQYFSDAFFKPFGASGEADREALSPLDRQSHPSSA
jgi:hypothetical protein